MSFLDTIDTFLIEKVFEPVSDWCNDRYGSTSYLIAAFFGIGYLTAFCIGYVYREERSMAGTLFAGFIVLMVLYGIHIMLRLHEMTRYSIQTTAVNSLRYTFRFGRIFLLILTVPFIPLELLTDFYADVIQKWTHIARDVFAVCMVYFASCTTKPRKPKEVRKYVPVLDGA
jgi:hypothetical protein